jgi:hypothetical protein
MFTFFLVLLTIIAIYIYFYHGDILKKVILRQRDQNQQPQKLVLDSSSICSSTTSEIPPVRPPRMKRLSQTLKDVSDHSLGVDSKIV